MNHTYSHIRDDNRRESMSDDKLTISFWIWGIFDLKSNPYYDDLERRFVEFAHRGDPGMTAAVHPLAPTTPS